MLLTVCSVVQLVLALTAHVAQVYWPHNVLNSTSTVMWLPAWTEDNFSTEKEKIKHFTKKMLAMLGGSNDQMAVLYPSKLACLWGEGWKETLI